MGVLKDIVDIIKSEEVLDEIKQNATTKKYSSLAARASEGTMQFPTLVSDSIDIDTLQMITKALERNFSTFLQTVLSMNSVVDTSKSPDITDYLRQFHQNSPKINANDVTRHLVKVLDEYAMVPLENGKTMLCETYDASTAKCAMDNRNQLVDLMESLRPEILNDKFIPDNRAKAYMFRNRELSAKYNSLTEAKNDMDSLRKKNLKLQNRDLKNRVDISTNEADPYNLLNNKYYNEYRLDNARLDNTEKRFTSSADQLILRGQNARNAVQIQNQQKELNDLSIQDTKETNPLKKQQLELQIQKLDAEITKNLKQSMKTDYDMNQYTLPPSMLKDNDVKKANELIATTLHVRLHMVNKNGEPQGVNDFILGVKSIMHLVKSGEMVDNLVAACKNNNKLFNFLRWTTGEISFFKDFWLNMSEMKRSIANEGRGASRWWNALKKRRSLGKVSDTALTKNKILPNTTIVISAEEAEIIKSYYGYDIRNPYFLSKVMDAYYLLGFVIVDTGSQVAHFYFDGDDDFESVSFSGLEKENSRDERKFKEMLKTINRN